MSFTGTGFPAVPPGLPGFARPLIYPCRRVPGEVYPRLPGLYSQLGGDGSIADGVGLSPSPTRCPAVVPPSVLVFAVPGDSTRLFDW